MVLITSQYRKLFPQEYADMVAIVKQKRSDTVTKFAEIKGLKNEIISRKLGEMPSTLFQLFQIKFTDEEKVWFKTKEAMRWFYRRYPEFRVTKEI